jgi:hypothetical protein
MNIEQIAEGASILDKEENGCEESFDQDFEVVQNVDTTTPIEEQLEESFEDSGDNIINQSDDTNTVEYDQSIESAVICKEVEDSSNVTISFIPLSTKIESRKEAEDDSEEEVPEVKEIQENDSKVNQRPVSVSPEDLPKVLEIVSVLESTLNAQLSPIPSTPDPLAMASDRVCSPISVNKRARESNLSSDSQDSNFTLFTAQSMESRKKKTYVPSTSLMKTTQNRVIDAKTLEEEKNTIKEKDDIWWSVRGSKADKCILKSKSVDAESKLNEPTKAYLASKSKKKLQDHTEETSMLLTKGKHPHNVPPVNKNSSTPKKIEKIENESSLLKPTKASLLTKEVGKEPAKKLRMLCEIYNTGPKDVKSRYAEQVTHAKKVNEIEQMMKVTPVSRKVKAPSPNLLKANKATEANRRNKYCKENGDPRESGWTQNVKGYTIPLSVF